LSQNLVGRKKGRKTRGKNGGKKNCEQGGFAKEEESNDKGDRRRKDWTCGGRTNEQIVSGKNFAGDVQKSGGAEERHPSRRPGAFKKGQSEQNDNTFLEREEVDVKKKKNTKVCLGGGEPYK